MPQEGPKKKECNKEEYEKEEYRVLTDNMRHYGSIRFAQLTLYFALTAGLVSAVFTANAPLSPVLRLTLKIIGVLAAIAFAVMEERGRGYWEIFHDQALNMRETLGYTQYVDRPSGKVFTATNATRLLIWGSGVFWILSALFGL